MPNDTSTANAVLQALGYALFVRDQSGALRIAGDAPAWLEKLWPQIGQANHSLDPASSPFLENFLIDAEQTWRAGGDERARSGPWVEQDSLGENVQLEATALTVDGRALLLLERLGEVFEAKKSMLQKARETVIAYQRLNSEIQKKEILLHCVAEDMTAALGNIVTALRLLETESASPKSRMLLGLASRSSEEQQALIHKVLAIFADELGGLFGQNGDSETAADLQIAVRKAIESTTAQATEKKVKLIAPVSMSREAAVALDEQRLERLIVNLIENALAHFSGPGEIALAIDEETDALILRVEDDGETVPQNACDDLFAKSEPLLTSSSAPALRLHFCRMIAESCGGEIGCSEREGGGNRFWIRLPKSAR